jgi:DNA-binding transcriptional regulator/RsmH inhibitor MraZ
MPAPFTGFRLYRVDDRWRLSLPAKLESYVKWYKPRETQDCLALPGVGGMVVFPPSALEEHREMMARLDGTNLRLRDINSPTYELARTGTLAWTVTISGGRFELPKEARDLGIVPPEAEATVALVAFGGVFEVWRPEELRAQVQKSAGRWADLRAQGLIDL